MIKPTNIFINLFLLLSCLACFTTCRKDVGKLQVPEPPPKPKITFVFVNRLGYKNDSTRHGIKDTVFSGGCFDLKYYNKRSDSTWLLNTCYSRNYHIALYRLTDSITFATMESSSGSKYGYQIELVWKYPVFPYTTKVLRYNTINYDAGQIIKTPKDTIIKFIWPDDTASGKYIKTYQWP